MTICIPIGIIYKSHGRAYIDNRDKIFSIALSLFAVRGYDAVGVQEIVESAGLTKPTMYHYFGSKRGLLDALFTEYGGRLNLSVTGAARYSGDLPKTLEDLFFTFTSFAKENHDFYRLMLSLYFAPRDSEANEAAKSWNEKIFSIIEEMFRQASLQHGNMKNRQSAYSASFIGTINTYIGMSLNGYLELSDVLVRAAVKQFMHGIFS